MSELKKNKIMFTISLKNLLQFMAIINRLKEKVVNRNKNIKII